MAEEYISSYLAEKLKLYGYPVKYEEAAVNGIIDVLEKINN